MGLARVVHPEEAYTLTGETGTYLYMAPEMVRCMPFIHMYINIIYISQNRMGCSITELRNSPLLSGALCFVVVHMGLLQNNMYMKRKTVISIYKVFMSIYKILIIIHKIFIIIYKMILVY